MVQEKISRALLEEGLEYKEKNYEGIPDASLLDLESIENEELAEIMLKVLAGEPRELLLSKVFINYLSETIEEAPKQARAKALVFGKITATKEKMQSPLGFAKPSALLEGNDNKLQNGISTLGFLPVMKGKFKLAINDDIIEKSIYHDYECSELNFSKASILYAKDSENAFGWVEKEIETFSNPILALSHAIKKFNNNFGGITHSGKYYANPNILINDNFIVEKIENSYGINKIYLDERYKIMRRAGNYFVYLMNFQGQVKEFQDKLRNREKLGFSEVIISEELFAQVKKSMKKGSDFHEINGIKMAKLTSLIGVLASENIANEIVLCYSENSMKVKSPIGKTLREAKLSGFKAGDIMVKFKAEPGSMKITYSRAKDCNAKELILKFSERYIISETKRGNIALVV